MFSLRFLTNTWAEVSFLAFWKDKLPSSHTFEATNMTPINVYGESSVTRSKASQPTIPRMFFVTDISQPVTGANFIDHYVLTANIKSNSLVHLYTGL